MRETFFLQRASCAVIQRGVLGKSDFFKTQSHGKQSCTVNESNLLVTFHPFAHRKTQKRIEGIGAISCF